MIRLKTICLAVLCAISLSLGTYASSGLFSIQTDAPVSAPLERTVSIAPDTVLEFSPTALARWLGVADESLSGITVTRLPAARQGLLVLRGVEVEPYQYIGREELEWLCFVPNETAVSASVVFVPQGVDNAPVSLSIHMLDAVNAPPVVENASFQTMQGMQLSGTVNAVDPDGDTIAIKVVNEPKKGQLVFTGTAFVYTPFQNKTGSDSFTYCAVDPFGNYSAEATVDIKIESGRRSIRFADMSGNPSEYAAVKLNESGVFSGEKVGGSWFFHPGRQVTRGEFLVMLLAAAGLDSALPATVNTGLPDDAQLPLWLKPYIRRAVDQGIWNPSAGFHPDQIPTRAEAVVLVDLAAKITDVQDYALRMGDIVEIPGWALSSYKDLAAYRMLDLHDGNAHPDAALDNAYAADLLWQLYKHTHRR